MSQTYDNFEIIFVDDFSTDGSVKTLEKVLLNYPSCNGDKWKLIRNERNMGVGYSRKIGMQNATGEYMIHVDSDDYIDKAFLEKLVGKAEIEQSDITICNNAAVCNNGIIIRSVPHITDKSELIKRLLIGTFHNGLCNKLIRTSIISENKIYPEGDFRMLEDKSILYKCVYFSNRIAYVDDALYYYRDSNGSLTKTKQKSLMSIIESLINQIDEFFNANEADDVINEGVTLFKLRSSGAFLIYGGPVDKAVIKSTSVSKILKQSYLPIKYRCALVFYKFKMNFLISVMQCILGLNNG